MPTVPSWGAGNISSLSSCNSTGRGSAAQALCLLGAPLGRALTIGEVERGVGIFGCGNEEGGKDEMGGH